MKTVFAKTTSLLKASLLGFGLSLAVSACSTGNGFEASYHPLKSDTKPHPGVAKAHRYPIHGIDISKWQGDIDWAEVKRAGTAFVYMKATEGGDHLDERFKANWEGARAAGLPRGAYHFMFWCRSAEEQASWFKQNVPRDADALPPVLDVEWNGHSKTCPKRIDPELARQKIAIMLKAMTEHTGKKPVIYTDIPFHADVLEGHSIDNDFWLRSVAAEPHEKYNARGWKIWQFTTTGRVPGIKGAVDRNAYAGTRKDWARYLALNGVISRQVALAEEAMPDSE
ncbi:MAG: glycoside hydrolase [Rhizobiales bacterium PAR1]|nr:MAG: glycoside hydrolase [Rhizobiales bacterium PAR1]